ncbi:MAG: aminoglycoside phosphotransferase [Rhodobacter sp. CACIA14H1]|nr:MAG: aminoglycoside phosphotransferase [Rhodobacter sp. CACIA14H1]
MTDRLQASRAFLSRAGWGSATRRFLAGDASDRSYDRLTLGGKSAVLMDAPPGKGDDTATFTAIARHLASLGLSPPAILAEDHAEGFLLLEDLGDGLYARLMESDSATEGPLYQAATDVLVHLQRHPAAEGLPDPDAADWAAAASFALTWYAFAATGKSPDPAMFETVLTDLLRLHADGPRVMILRDFHAENLLWLPSRTGVARVGLLDFQLAQMGQPGYDLVSLLQDARRDVSPATEAAMIDRFCAATGIDPSAFSTAYATLGAQRALRILGIFARLCLKGGKGGYVRLIPRVWALLQRNLAHPALAPLAGICHQLLPEPTPGTLQRIGAQCGQYPLR